MPMQPIPERYRSGAEKLARLTSTEAQELLEGSQEDLPLSPERPEGYTPVVRFKPGQEQVFNSLVKQWRADTLLESSMQEIVLHPAYQQIIGMGPDILPLIFHELKTRPYHWFWALHAITREDPLEFGDTFAVMVGKWLDWGKQHDYIS